MKKLSFLLLTCLFYLISNAQNPAIKAGGDIKSFDNYYGLYKSTYNSLGVGIGLEYPLSQQWSISGTIGYNGASSEETGRDEGFNFPVLKQYRLSMWTFIPEAKYYFNQVYQGFNIKARIGVRNFNEKETIIGNFPLVKNDTGLSAFFGVGIGLSFQPNEVIIVDLYSGVNYDGYSEATLFDIGFSVGYIFTGG